MISANTNLQALRLQNCLSSNTNALNQALERMSTGYRINRAADDAAGYFVATNLNTRIRGLKVANKNVSDGTSLLNIAEESLSQMNNLFQRMRDLALQSANGVYSDEQRNAMQMEVNQLLEEITRIKNSTEYDGKNLFGVQTKLEKDQTYTDTTVTRAVSPVPLASTFSIQPVAARATAIDNEPSPIETGQITLAYNQQYKLSLGTKVYTLTGNSGSPMTIKYTYDTNTQSVIFDGNSFSVTSAANQDNDITVNGNSVGIYGSNNGNDNIVVNGTGCTVLGYSGDDTISINGTSNYIRGGDGNDVITILSGTNNRVFGENGDDTFYINGNNNAIYTDAGSNRVEVSGNKNFIQGSTGTNQFIANTGAAGNIFDGGISSSTIIDNGTDTGKLNISGSQDFLPTSGILGFRGGDGVSNIQTITLFGKTYSIKYTDTSIYNNRFLTYSYDSANDRLTFTGDYFEIASIDGQIDNLIVNGSYNTYNLGDEDDSIIINSGSRNTINGGDGNDNITTNSSASINSIYGAGGNDNIVINSNSNYIQDGEGTNNITINSGKSSNIINEENSISNTIIDNGTKTGIINSPNNEKELPSSGTLAILSGQSMTITLAGKEYTIENKSTNRNGSLQYFIDESTGQIRFNSNAVSMYIRSKAGQENNVKLSGDNIFFYGSELNDKIQIEGTWNYVWGGAGDDEIIVNNVWNQVYGEDGDDRIILNSQSYTRVVDGGNGNDYIEVNSSGSQNIRGGAGDDEIVVNGTNNRIYGGNDDDTIKINKAGNDAYGEAGNDSIYINTENDKRVASGGAGNDKIYINSSNAGGISGGDGDDWFYVASGANDNIINGGSGTNTIEDHGNNTGTINIQNRPESIGLSGTLVFEPGQTLTDIMIGDKKYTIKNSSTNAQSLIYSYDQRSGVISFEGDYFNITTGAGQKDKVILSGNSNSINTGDLDDEITINKGVDNRIYGGDGNDTITMNSSNNHIYGDKGDDTITLNAQNTSSYTVDGGDDNDTIILNSNNNTNIKGGNGNDSFINYGTNNTIDGTAGTNTLTENGTGTIRQNISIINASKIPNAISVKSGEAITFNINGKTYTVKNNNASDTNFEYSIQNGIINFTASNFEITSKSGQNDNYSISGSNNIINAVNGTNNITIQSGSDNTINGGTGADTIIMNSENNNIYGNSGNDNIILNASNDASHYIDGQDGNDTITVNSNGNVNITGGIDQDTLTINGNNNTVNGGEGNDTFNNNGDSNKIFGDGGYNTFRENGTNSTVENISRVVLLNNQGTISIQANVTMDYVIGGKTYTITNNDSVEKALNYLSSGSELTLISDNISISGAAGQTSNLKIEGNNNTITTADGNDIIKVYGNNNTINSGSGNDSILVSGDQNIVNAENGNDTITLTDGDRNVIDGGAGTDVFISNGTNSTYSNMNEKQEISKPFYLQVGADGAEHSRIEVSLGFMIPVIDINISSPDNALNAITNIDSIMDTIQTKMSEIGSYQNRLESVLASNTTTIENLTAAKSTIMDADIAEESASFVKRRILQNITGALLAQANNLPYQTISRLIS